MLPGLLYLTLAMGPSIAVEVEEAPGESMTSLKSWLVQRLIEEGVTIAPTGDRADRVVRLRDTEDAVVIETDGETHRVEHGPTPIMRLEILHRARLVVEEPSEAEPAPVVPQGSVIGMRSEGEAPPGFEGALESQLLEAGYVLTPDPRAGDPVLCVHHDKVAVEASVTKVESACGAPTIRLTYTQIQAPGGVDPIIAAVEGEPPEAEPVPQERPTASDIPKRTKDEAVPSPRRAKRRRRTPWSDDNAEVRIGGGAGLAIRGGIDAAVRSFLRIGLAPGPGAMLVVGVVPSRAGSRVRTVDTILAAGPDLHLRKKWFGFDASIVGGANIHAYQLDQDKGGRVSWYTGLPLSVSFGKQFGARFHVFTEGALAGIRPWEHRINESVRWRRTAWTIRVGLGVSYGWRIM